ncbi:Transcriptional regulator FleQ [Gammaproteobacteria bacterium]
MPLQFFDDPLIARHNTLTYNALMNADLLAQHLPVLGNHDKIPRRGRAPVSSKESRGNVMPEKSVPDKSTSDKPTADKSGGTGKSVLVIETDTRRRQELKAVLEFIDYQAPLAKDGKEAVAALATAGELEAILLGRCDTSRAEVLRQIRARDPSLPVVLVTEVGEDAALGREAVFSRLEYPVRFQQLTDALQNARFYRENQRRTNAQRPNSTAFRRMVGTSPALRFIRNLMQQVAGTDASVLILGESGTGKEVVARNLHDHSNRRQGPFVPVNCGAIPADLLESELFGHEKGAFTGAISARPGRFELAEGGTLFLDEIGDMSLTMQVKLLRVLQERCFERVGGTKTLQADVRIIAATHRNLEGLIATGQFRDDLYYRLNVFPIEVPPLRERPEDVPLLIDEIVSRLEAEKRGSVRFSETAKAILMRYSWPGNVRELSNLVERLTILYPYGLVDGHDLPSKYRGSNEMSIPAATEAPPPSGRVVLTQAVVDDPLTNLLPELPEEGVDLKALLNNLESSLIRQALERHGGVVAHAAAFLKMRRTTLVEKCRKYGLQRQLEESAL